MADILGTEHNYRSLSIKDLLQARDQYHYHLLNKANVVGTAIGLYLIRRDDPWPDQNRAALRRASAHRRGRKSVRTITNSEVRDYSWPCVLALVRKWVEESDFGGGEGQLHPDQMVPKTLYLPDGRMVPVCVVKVDQGEPDPRVMPEWHWPAHLYGGGMPIVVETQQREHRATAGCLVSDGHTVYALTSRHVCGPEGEPVFTLARGRRVLVGRSSARQLTRLPFEQVYPEFPARKTFVNLDVGMVELENVNEWTSQVLGLWPIGPMADLNELNITLRLIEAPVVAAGAASGRLEGRIKALFYRYKSIGGYDYVADFLIAPRVIDADGPGASAPVSQTQPGDSGAVWHLVVTQAGDDERDEEEHDEFEGTLRPLAVEWGGQVFVENAAPRQFAFALATSLTTVCQALDVELVLEHNTGVLPYWGQMGHYSIAAFATQALATGKLQSFVQANLDRISFSLGQLTPKQISERLKQAKDTKGFVPLADVPDIIWKHHKTQVRGGRDDRFVGKGRTTGPEHPTHFADIDEPLAGKTLRALCVANSDNVSVEFWQGFYDRAGHKTQDKRGLLPFRVWQFFDAMKAFAAGKDAAGFLCAAGLMSHYVGDACQPLHGSMFADGFADQETTIVHPQTGKTEKSHVGAGVHSSYETHMIDRFAAEIVDALPKAVKKGGTAIPAVKSGKDAAVAIVALMDRSAKRIPPRTLVNAYVNAGGKDSAAVQKALWEKFGTRTVAVMADGARVLAAIWAGAWAAGNGNAIASKDLGPVDFGDLSRLYEDEKFVSSLDLDHIGEVLK